MTRRGLSRKKTTYVLWQLVAVEEVDAEGEVVRVELLRQRGATRVFRARFWRQSLFEIPVARLSATDPHVADQVNLWGDFHAMSLVDLVPVSHEFEASSKAAALRIAIGLVECCFERIGGRS